MSTETIHDIKFKLPSRLFSSKSSKSIIKLKCIDCHAGGEPARIVLSGVPKFPSSDGSMKTSSALDKRNYMMKHMDHLRKILLLEPRGYPCQNVNFIFQPTELQNEMTNKMQRQTVDNDNATNRNPSYDSKTKTTHDSMIQYVIGEQNKIYPLMSGHNTICVATALLECNIISMKEPLTEFDIEAPSGPIHIQASCCGGKVTSITLQNAPSFVEKLDVVVNVPKGVGNVTVDIAYGGMWYAVVNINQFRNNPLLIHHDIHQINESNASKLCRIGEMIKVACREQYPVNHPIVDYPGVDILVWIDDETTTKLRRNTVVMSNNKLDWDRPETWTGMLDRSPCGTGTCAVMATMHARGMLHVGESFVHESIVGTQFVGTILEETTVADKLAIIPQIEGSAYITQYTEVVVDQQDPFREGFQVKDIW